MAFSSTSGFVWSSANALLKIQFRKLVNSYYVKAPFFGMLKKKVVQDGGRYLAHTVVYSPGGHASSTFSATAMGTATTQTGDVEFGLKWRTYYGVKRFNGLMLANLKSSEEAYIKGMAGLQKYALDMVTHRLGVAVYGNGYGVLGRCKTVATTIITLETASDANNFSIGMRLASTSSATASAPTATTDTTGYIERIDRSAGTLKLTAATGVTNNDYLYAFGDGGSWFAGLGAWIPTTAPSAAETRFGTSVDRTPDVDNLAGNRVDISAYTSREEGLIDAASETWRRTNGMITHFLMNPKQLAALIKELGGKVIYSRVSAQNENGPVAGVGFSSVKIYGPAGPIECVGDPFCPLNTAWGINIDEVALVSCGGKEIPAILDEDGNQILRVADADTYELRVGAYCLMTVDKPADFCAITMPTLT